MMRFLYGASCHGTATEAKRKLDTECLCSHPYAYHRLEHSQCRCVCFTPRNQRAWNQLLR